MSLDMQKLSPHLKEVLLNLKHMSPMQRFNELSRPRFELQWKTMAFLYGIEKLEAQGWIISDNEILNPAAAVNGTAAPVQTAQEIGGSGDREIGKPNPGFTAEDAKDAQPSDGGKSGIEASPGTGERWTREDGGGGGDGDGADANAGKPERQRRRKETRRRDLAAGLPVHRSHAEAKD